LDRARAGHRAHGEREGRRLRRGEVAKKLREQGFRIEVDTSADKLGAKIRNARLSRVPYMLVVGAKEAETGQVGVRSRDKGELGAMPLETFVGLLSGESKPPRG
jgi:threonyl-tRNA synthetase